VDLFGNNLDISPSHWSILESPWMESVHLKQTSCKPHTFPIHLPDSFPMLSVTGVTSRNEEIDLGILSGCVSMSISTDSQGDIPLWVDLSKDFDSFLLGFLGISKNDPRNPLLPP
jgi:hypothetical protein